MKSRRPANSGPDQIYRHSGTPLRLELNMQFDIVDLTIDAPSVMWFLDADGDDGTGEPVHKAIKFFHRRSNAERLAAEFNDVLLATVNRRRRHEHESTARRHLEHNALVDVGLRADETRKSVLGTFEPLTELPDDSNRYYVEGIVFEDDA